MSDLILHGYWRSSAAYRVRIALALKGVAYDQASHDLRTGAQRSADYAAIAPHRLVPALETADGVLIQSPAILEWLEERYPEPALLPATPGDRAVVRGMAAIIACDIHPLNNLRVVNTLRGDFGADSAAVKGWAGRWMAEGFAALETLVAQHGGDFAFGTAPTIADVMMVPQFYSAERYEVDTAPYARLRAVVDRMLALPAVAAAHPDRQPDADAA